MNFVFLTLRELSLGSRAPQGQNRAAMRSLDVRLTLTSHALSRREQGLARASSCRRTPGPPTPPSARIVYLM